jgi:PhnB protein
MPAINPYLHFNGVAEDAFNFYKSVFGGEFSAVMRFKDMPSENLTEKDANKIMHMSLPITGGDILMGSDVPEHMGQTTNGGNFHICINPDSEEQATQLFNGLSAGGKVEVPLNKMPWNALFAMFADKFGVEWMINYELK